MAALPEEIQAEIERINTRLIAAIDDAEETAYGSDTDGELSRERALAIDFFLGKNVEPSPEGRSQVSDRSVFETVQWILPSLLRIYAGGGNVVEFEPLGPDDELSAQQESDYLNYVITQKNRWFDLCLTWFQDALITKNAYCLAYYEERFRTETERYEGQSEEQVAYLTQGDVEVVQFSQYPAPDLPPEPVMTPQGPLVDLQTGTIVTRPVMLADIVIRKRSPDEKLCLEVLPPERCKISEHTPSHTLEKCDYFEYWDYKTASECRSLGLNVSDEMMGDVGIDTDEDDARDRFNENLTRDSGYSREPAMKRGRVRMIWIRHDSDEDGIAELQYVIRLGNFILHREECSRIPVSSIVPFIMTHRHIGISLADIVVDLQRIMTAIERQGLDNLFQSNNVRYAHSTLVNLDDMLSSVPGGTVEIDTEGPIEGHVIPLAPTFLFPQAIQGLEYMDVVKEKRTGINKQFSGIDEKSVRQTATGIAQLSTMAAQRVEQIARTFAPGIEYLFSVAHELVIKHGHKPDVVKLRGQWVEVDPRTWKTGRDLKVSVGFGAGNKDVQAARAANVWQMQLQAAQAGTRIVQEPNLYEAAIAYAKAADFQQPEKFWTDPRQLPPPPPPPPTTDQIYAQVEGVKLQSNERIRASEIRSEEKIKLAELSQKDKEAKLEAEVRLLIEKMKQGGSVDVELMRGVIKSLPVSLETKKLDEAHAVLDSLLKSSGKDASEVKGLMAELKEKIKAISEDMEAPKEILRDETGKVVGLKSGKRVRKVKRKDGKVTGLD